MDIITRYSDAQTITSSAVGGLVNTFGSDKARNVFLIKPYLIKILVAAVAAGGGEGIRVEYRVDTNVNLETAPIVIGDSGILLPTQLETVGKIHEFRNRPIAIPEGYDFHGIWFNVVDSVFSGGFKLTTWLADEGSEAGVLGAPMTL